MRKEIGRCKPQGADLGRERPLKQMGCYYVERSANNFDECAKFRGYWTGGKCRISTALNPGCVSVVISGIPGSFVDQPAPVRLKGRGVP